MNISDKLKKQITNLPKAKGIEGYLPGMFEPKGGIKIEHNGSGKGIQYLAFGGIIVEGDNIFIVTSKDGIFKKSEYENGKLYTIKYIFGEKIPLTNDIISITKIK